jgi:tetratricopeptide (TPR) repeat protein
MSSTALSNLRRWLAAGACLLLAAGCASAPPAPPLSELRQQARRADESARTAYQRRNWDVAARLFERSAAMFGAMDDHLPQAVALHNRGQALLQAGQPDAARDAFDAALQINRRLGRRPEQAHNIAGLAQCDSRSGRTDDAITALRQALDIAGGAQPLTAGLQNDLAVMLLAAGAGPEEIIGLLSAALQTNHARRDRRGMAVSHLNLGRARLTFGEHEPASRHLAEALELFRALEDPAGLAHTHETLAGLYASRQDTDRARYHHDQARDKFIFLNDEAALQRLEQSRP